MNKVCVGQAMDDLNNIIQNFKDIKDIVSNINDQMLALKDNVNNDVDKVSSDNGNIYLQTLASMRKDINSVLMRSNKMGNRIIPKENTNVEYINIVDKVCYVLPSFNVLYYLQETNSNGNKLYFTGDPNIVPYYKNNKTENVTSYPVWNYIFNKKITVDYTKFREFYGSPISYNNMLGFRLFDKEFIRNVNRIGVPSNNKYQFGINSNVTFTNTLVNVQGVNGDIYSVVDDITDLNIVLGLNAIDNTIYVINTLMNNLDTLITSIINTKGAVYQLA